MTIEKHGAGWRVRIRWRGLAKISISVPTEQDAQELDSAMVQLKDAGRRDLLAAVEQDIDLLSEVVRQLRTTKPQALTLDSLIKAQTAAPVGLGAAITAWEHWCLNGGENRRRTTYSASTLSYYKVALEAFVAFLPTGNHTALVDITPAILNAWRRHMVANKTKAATVNRYVAAVQAFWSWMADPTKGNYPDIFPIRLPALVEKRNTTRARTAEEIERVLALVSPKKWRLPLRILIETGMRDSEMRFLRWEDVYLDELEISVESHDERRLKTEASTRRVAITEATGKALRSLGPGQGYVFPELTLNRYTLAQAWKRACKKAGLKIRIHDLRHSYTVRLIQAGNDIATVRDVLGHASIATTDRYSREVNKTKTLDRVRKTLAVAPVLPQSSESGDPKIA